MFHAPITEDTSGIRGQYIAALVVHIMRATAKHGKKGPYKKVWAKERA